MNILFKIIFTLLPLMIALSTQAQSEFEKYKQKQNADLDQFKNDYAQDIARMDQHYKAFLADEREMYRAYKNLGYIPQKIVDKVNRVEKMYPKQTTFIPVEESEQILKTAAKKWENTIKEIDASKQAKQELVSIADAFIPLDEEESLLIPDIVKNMEIKPLAKTENQTAELRMEIDANRPVMCPLPAKSYRISSPFNKARKHPILNIVRKHEGVDLAAPLGTKIYAAADGVVTISKYSKSAGKYIVINHQNGYTTSYMHLSKSFAKKGQKIKRGQVIGEVGNTGISTGNHLHYEIRKSGNAFDPEPFIIEHFN